MTAVVKQLNTNTYTHIHTPTQAHKHTRNAHNYIYQSPNINMISALPARETRVLYYSDKSPKNELRITFDKMHFSHVLR